MTARHIQTVCSRLRLEIGYAGDIGASGLTEAIREALGKGGVVEEAEVVYMKAEAPEERFCAINLWAPEATRQLTLTEKEALRAEMMADEDFRAGIRDGVEAYRRGEYSPWDAVNKEVNERLQGDTPEEDHVCNPNTFPDCCYPGCNEEHEPNL